jgi:hypothetical protein
MVWTGFCGWLLWQRLQKYLSPIFRGSTFHAPLALNTIPIAPSFAFFSLILSSTHISFLQTPLHLLNFRIHLAFHRVAFIPNLLNPSRWTSKDSFSKLLMIALSLHAILQPKVCSDDFKPYANCQVEKPTQFKLTNNACTLRFLVKVIIVVVIMWEDILLVSAGSKLGQNAIAFNVITTKDTVKPHRYEPVQYTFVPLDANNDDATLRKLVKFINLTVFGHPCIPSPSSFFLFLSGYLTCSTSSQMFQNHHQS